MLLCPGSPKCDPPEGDKLLAEVAPEGPPDVGVGITEDGTDTDNADKGGPDLSSRSCSRSRW